MAFDQDMFQRTIPEVLMRSASRTPDKDAFICGDARLSYAQTVLAMRQLTTVLRKAGVGRGDRVAVFLPQSLESAVAIYGILHAGAAFVPIDPATPPARMQAILDKCGVRHLITQEGKRADIARLIQTPHGLDLIVGLDAGLDAISTKSWAEVFAAMPSDGPQITDQDLSYVMWTSGSTGAPKGMTHVYRNGLIYAGNLAETHGLCADDRFLGLSPLHFDMAVMDYIAAPLVGATTIIVPEAVAKLPAALTCLAAQQRATVIYTVPFAMTQMLHRGAMEKYDLTALRWMIFGGENFPAKHLRALMQALPQARFANAFGPAETHQISSYTLPGPPEDGAAIPVGKPWRTLEAMVVDAKDHPVTPGEAGELLVRSPSCMLGYWDDPVRTDHAFFRRPLGGTLSQVFYRTGDLVRQDPDGMMYFLGRVGRQIKLRGFRIELDEVEAVLAAAPGVQDCAVVCDDTRQHLVGFLRPDAGQTPDLARLKARCRDHLPPYAVPSELRVIRAFPRTGSAKIDRAALVRLELDKD